MSVPMAQDDVIERVGFAERRLNDLLHLNSGDLPRANASERQQLIQEFFFHLVGATEALAQLVNEIHKLGLDSEAVSVPTVLEKLPSMDSVKITLDSLYMKTRGQPLPKDLYSDDGYIFRILNYRHQVTHRHRNPFFFRLGSMPLASFMLDPRNENLGPSNKSVQDEMQYMLKLVRTRCENVLNLL